MIAEIVACLIGVLGQAGIENAFGVDRFGGLRHYDSRDMPDVASRRWKAIGIAQVMCGRWPTSYSAGDHKARNLTRRARSCDRGKTARTRKLPHGFSRMNDECWHLHLGLDEYMLSQFTQAARNITALSRPNDTVKGVYSFNPTCPASLKLTPTNLTMECIQVELP